VKVDLHDKSAVDRRAGGLRMGVRGSIIPAAIAPMVPAHRRASVTASYGMFCFLGGAAIGILYDT
jgi:hypothetical protein